jgi:hypothetical protein
MLGRFAVQVEHAAQFVCPTAIVKTIATQPRKRVLARNLPGLLAQAKVFARASHAQRASVTSPARTRETAALAPIVTRRPPSKCVGCRGLTANFASARPIASAAFASPAAARLRPPKTRAGRPQTTPAPCPVVSPRLQVAVAQASERAARATDSCSRAWRCSACDAEGDYPRTQPVRCSSSPFRCLLWCGQAPESRRLGTQAA